MSEAPVQTDFLELDLRRYELRRGSSVLKLEKIPMELLILLLNEETSWLAAKKSSLDYGGRTSFSTPNKASTPQFAKFG